MSIITQQIQNNLKRWNFIMGCLHLFQGAVILFLSQKRLFEFTFTLPQIQTVPKVDGQMTRPIIHFVAEHAFSLNLGYLLALFLALSALAHFITILPRVYPWYLNNLGKRMNLIRWWEYALSSSIMIVVIATLCNITDASIIILLFAVNACMNLFGAMMEKHNSARLELHTLQNASLPASEQKNFRPDWSAYLYGCFAGIIPWIIMGIYFFTVISRTRDITDLPQNIKDVLNLVQFIFPALFVFFNLFAINMFLQYKGVGRWKDYLWGEKIYILLSLLAKSFLAWFIFGGTLRP